MKNSIAQAKAEQLVADYKDELDTAILDEKEAESKLELRNSDDDLF